MVIAKPMLFSAAVLVALAAAFLLPDIGAGDTGANDRPSAPTAAPAGRVDLVEASGIAVRGRGKVAIIGGDETTGRLWAVSLEDFALRWELVFPKDTPILDDIEALAPCGKHSLFVSCAQSRTKTREKDKPERNRLAFVTLTEDARRITSVRVYERLRYHLVMYLRNRGRDLFENPGAIAMNGPNRGGLNVEGMAWWNDELLLGLRSPVAKGGAVVIAIREPLNNILEFLI